MSRGCGPEKFRLLISFLSAVLLMVCVLDKDIICAYLCTVLKTYVHLNRDVHTQKVGGRMFMQSSDDAWIPFFIQPCTLPTLPMYELLLQESA